MVPEANRGAETVNRVIPSRVHGRGQRDGIMEADPLPAMCDRLIPNFFSRSIFNRPISGYRRSSEPFNIEHSHSYAFQSD